MSKGRKNLIKYMNTLGINNKELSKLSGVAPNTIGRLVSGASIKMTPATAIKLCRVLGCDFTELLF